MLLGVVRIDMALTDERVLEVIKKLLNGQEGQLTYMQIANEAGCTDRTVFNASRRLKSAGRLELEGGKGRRPVTYKVSDAN